MYLLIYCYVIFCFSATLLQTLHLGNIHLMQHRPFHATQYAKIDQILRILHHSFLDSLKLQLQALQWLKLNSESFCNL